MSRYTRLLAAAVGTMALLATSLLATSPAEARHRGHGFFRGAVYPGPVFYPRPYYVPPPVYVMRPVAYIPPPPVYYGYGYRYRSAYGYGYRYGYRYRHRHRATHRYVRKASGTPACVCKCCPGQPAAGALSDK
jgi:hypothetical protein